jgi:hypothetical protein
LALCISDCAVETEYGDMIRALRKAVHLLHKKVFVNILEGICPAASPTRWTGIFDCAFWILRHHQKIKEMILEGLDHPTIYNMTSDEIKGLSTAAIYAFVCLLPFKIATGMLEAERMSASMVRPILNRSIFLTKNLDAAFSISSMFSNRIERRILERFGKTDGGQLLDFLFHITPAGRFYLRLNCTQFGILAHGSDAEPFDICDETLPILPAFKAILDDFADHPTKYVDFESFANDVFMNFPGKLIDPHTNKRIYHLPPDDSGDSEEPFSPYEPPPEWMTSKEERRIIHHRQEETDDAQEEESEGEDETDTNPESDDQSDDEFSLPDTPPQNDKGPFDNAFRIIRHLAQQRDLDSAVANQVFEYFFHWITDDPEEVIPNPEYLKLGPRYWEVMSTMDGHREFANFVLPFLGIPASEAIVERAFWYQRRILGDQGMRMSAATEKARINLAMLRQKK